MRKKNAALILMLLSMAMLIQTGCGASSASMDSAVEEAAAMDVKEYEAVVTESAVAAENGAGMDTGAAESTSQEAEDVTTVTERKLIRTVDMNVETEEYDALIVNVETQIQALGGYIEYKDAYHGNNRNNSKRHANITARIPADKLNLFTQKVAEAGNVTYESESVEDVTLSYVDLDSHKRMLQKEQERLMELLETADTMEDIITIESRLSEVRYQIESMESQLRTYDNLVDYSTVNLYINEVERYTPVPEGTTWDKIKTGFSENVYQVTDGIKNFVVEFIIAIPILAVWAVVIVLAVIILRTILNRKKTKQLMKSQPVDFGIKKENKEDEKN